MTSRDLTQAASGVRDGKAAVSTPGPYWINHTPEQIHVCGAYGKILYRFPLDQEPLAQAQRAKLNDAAIKREDAERAAQERLRKAAPDLLKAAQRALRVLQASTGESIRPGNVLGELDAAIKKAIGQ